MHTITVSYEDLVELALAVSESAFVSGEKGFPFTAADQHELASRLWATAQKPILSEQHIAASKRMRKAA
jgi:hypothetical protein